MNWTFRNIMSFAKHDHKAYRSAPLYKSKMVPKLIHGDCFEHLHTINDETVDAIVCDLPYGSTRAAWDIALDLDALWIEYIRIAKPQAPIVLFSAQPFTSRLVMSQAGLFRHVWYWKKEKGTNFMRATDEPMRVIEEICVFSRNPRPVYFPQMVPIEKPYRHTMPLKRSAIHGTADGFTIVQSPEGRAYRTYSHNYPKNILEYNRDGNLVPTQKPVALMEYIVRTYTRAGDLVLDNTMGSGTTGVACKHLGRRFIGIERDAKHFEIAQMRIGATIPNDSEEAP